MEIFYNECALRRTVHVVSTVTWVRGPNPGGGARFSAPVQTGPGAQPASLYNGYRVFPEGKAVGAWR